MPWYTAEEFPPPFTLACPRVADEMAARYGAAHMAQGIYVHGQEGTVLDVSTEDYCAAFEGITRVQVSTDIWDAYQAACQALLNVPEEIDISSAWCVHWGLCPEHQRVLLDLHPDERWAWAYVLRKTLPRVKWRQARPRMLARDIWVMPTQSIPGMPPLTTGAFSAWTLVSLEEDVQGIPESGLWVEDAPAPLFPALGTMAP